MLYLAVVNNGAEGGIFTVVLTVFRSRIFLAQIIPALSMFNHQIPK